MSTIRLILNKMKTLDLMNTGLDVFISIQHSRLNRILESQNVTILNLKSVKDIINTNK